MTQNKVLITGSNRGLGKALSHKFDLEGYSVIEHKGSQHFNLSNYDQILSLSEFVKNQNVKILVNNAAIVCPNLDFCDYSPQLIYDMISVNLTAPIILSNMLCNNLTNIININSMVGLEIKPKRTLYSASKWGLRGFSNSLKKEQKGVKILDVYPTNIQTYPERINSMNLDYVVREIYTAFIGGKEELILDGRK